MKGLEIWQQVDVPEDLSALANRLNKLRMMSFEELKNLPEAQTEDIENDERKPQFSIYRNILDEGMVEIILQMYIPARNFFLFKFYQVTAEGFRINRKGERKPIPEEVLYGYM